MDLAPLDTEDINIMGTTPTPGNPLYESARFVVETDMDSGIDEVPPAIIDGYLRRAEVGTYIAPPKEGKTHSQGHLAICHQTGELWLGAIPVDNDGGNVLILDFESNPGKHREQLRNQAEALGYDWDEIRWGIKAFHFVGKPVDLDEIEAFIENQLDRYGDNFFSLVLMDPLYCVLGGINENDNSAMAAVFVRIRRMARRLNAAWLCNHHSSRGDQSAKEISDVGSGAGAQSRAVDCHAVIRKGPRMKDGNRAYVLDAITRSFEQPKPLAFQWEYPLFVPAHDVEAVPTRSRGRKTVEAVPDVDHGAADDAKVLAVLSGEWKSQRAIRVATGMRQAKVANALTRLTKNGLAEESSSPVNGNLTLVFRRKDHV